MTRKVQRETERSAKIKFILLEADLPEGDLSQITQAIQNALRGPAQVFVQPSSAKHNAIESRPLEDLAADEGIDGSDEVETSDPIPSKKPPRDRKPVKVDVVDIDLTSEPSWSDFVSKHTPKSDNDRHLLAAAFLKEHRGLVGITMHHAYTCYRAAKWPTNINDFGQPFRNLKSAKLVTSGDDKGTFVINHLGIARVNEMK